MKGKKFWLPLISFLVATPVCLFIGVASGGAGHSDYVLARILFPFTMLGAILFDSITVPFVALSVVQFPLYGIVLGAANMKGKMLLASVALIATHALFATACFVVPDESFP